MHHTRPSSSSFDQVDESSCPFSTTSEHPLTLSRSTVQCYFDISGYTYNRRWRNARLELLNERRCLFGEVEAESADAKTSGSMTRCGTFGQLDLTNNTIILAITVRH